MWIFKFNNHNKPKAEYIRVSKYIIIKPQNTKGNVKVNSSQRDISDHLQNNANETASKFP